MAKDVTAGRRKREPRNHRLEIIEAAAQAFMREGFASTSVDNIADLLGSTKGRVYYYFKNKTELFFAVHEENIRATLESIRPIAHGNEPAATKMERMIAEHINAIMTRLPFQRVSLLGLEMQIIGRTSPEEREILDQLTQSYREFESLFLAVLEEGMADGTFRKGDASIIVKSLIGAMNWLIMWYKPRAEDEAGYMKRIRDGMSGYIMNGLKQGA